jgi:predicted DNA-binding transcriptional regulator YafY
MSAPKPEIERRLARVLLILRLIQDEPREWTRERLSERFRTSARMLDNDLQLLRSVGYDIRRHRTGYALEISEP